MAMEDRARVCLSSSPFDLEELWRYTTGGFHPVILHDLIDGRYRVIHKLGHGGFATVWLCRDMNEQSITKYVALKILVGEIAHEQSPELLHIEEIKHLAEKRCIEESSSYISSPLESFKVDGPNGSHICIVYPVLGPRVSLGVFLASTDLHNILKSVCYKACKALDLLHCNGICHGVIGLDGLSEAKVLEILGQPVQNRVKLRSGEAHSNPSAPQHLIYPIVWDKVDVQYISKDPCIIDFGECFKISQPPSELGLPGPYRAPELLLQNIIGVETELWALACTLFEIRTGRKLFSSFDDEDDDYLDSMVDVLGVLPEPWWSTTWKGRRICYKDEPDINGRAIHIDENNHVDTSSTSTTHPSVAEGARSLEEKLAPGVWYMDLKPPVTGRHCDITDDERKSFADLLRKLLVFEPGERCSVAALLSHKWFRGGDS